MYSTNEKQPRESIKKPASGQVLIPQKIVAAMIPIQVGLGVCWAFRTECGHCKRGLDVICCHLGRPLRRVSLCGTATKSIPPCDTLLQGCGDVNSGAPILRLRRQLSVWIWLEKETCFRMLFWQAHWRRGLWFSTAWIAMAANQAMFGNKQHLRSGMQSFSFLLHPKGRKIRPKTCRECLSSNSMVFSWLWASHWGESSLKHITVGIRWAGVNAVNVEAKYQSQEIS